MKSNIDILLPIALALILPGLTLLTTIRYPFEENFTIFQTWFTGSFIVYLLWYILWFIWDLKSRKNRRWLILLIPLFSTILWRTISSPNSEEFAEFKWGLGFRMIMGSILLLAVQSALRAQKNISYLQLEKEQLQTENYKTQLKAIRAQIDPHFLFNTLNTLRSMVRQQHPNSEKFVMSLSDFYRKTLQHNENSTLPLSEELAVLESYLFVMKSRNEKAVSVNIQIDPGLYAHQLPSLALQIVVENCFKHNSMTSKMPLEIKVTHSNDSYISVSNNIQPKLGSQEESGFGLDLLQKRYELLNVAEGLIIEESSTHFTVKLKLISP